MRVVFDSNIYISALTLPGGQAEKALFRILEGADTLLISKPILDEAMEKRGREFFLDSGIDFAAAAEGLVKHDPRPLFSSAKSGVSQFFGVRATDQ